MLDDGRITDSQGRTVDFKNTILILTSNLGSSILLEGIGSDGEITQTARGEVEELLLRTFRPEFLNRLDEIVFYKPLTRDNIVRIVDLMADSLNRRLADKQLRCVITDEAKAYIVDNGFDPVYGARPLRRYMQKHVETLLSRKILEGELTPGSVLTVDAGPDGLTVRTA